MRGAVKGESRRSRHVSPTAGESGGVAGNAWSRVSEARVLRAADQVYELLHWTTHNTNPSYTYRLFESRFFWLLKGCFQSSFIYELFK